jgi:hypothetical protein
VSGPGRAPVEWADRERRNARKGVRRKVLAWAGLNPAAKRADDLMARARHGAVGEEWTAALLAQLPAGWTVFHGRKLPGFSNDYDHVLISPCGTAVVTLDSKRWHAGPGWETALKGGRVHCGREDRHKQITAVARYAARLERALNLPGVRVLPLLVVHGSRVRGGFLSARVHDWEGVVHVLGPEYLVPTLAAAPGEVHAGRAAALVRHVERVLPAWSG